MRGICIGSGLSLAMLSLGEADVSCTHLYDPESGIYNKPYLERLWLADGVEMIGGYMRQLVLAFRRDAGIDSLDQAFEGMTTGRYMVAMRNGVRGPGST